MWKKTPSTKLKKTCRLPLPAMGVTITYEPVVRGVIHSNKLCTYGGSTCAHIFKVTKNLVVDTFDMKTKKWFVSTFEDSIYKRETLGKLASDSSQSEMLNFVEGVLQELFAHDWKSEAKCQRQNPEERRN